MSDNPRIRYQSGFTLIEMLAVLTIVSLVAVSVSLHWSQPYQSVRFQSDLESLIDFDFKARRHAVDHQLDSKLSYDLSENRILASRWVDGVEKEASMKFSDGFELEKLVTVDGQATRNLETIEVSKQGATKTYAVLVRNAARQKWIIFSGRTGQTQITDNENDVEAIFKNLRLQGADAG